MLLQNVSSFYFAWPWMLGLLLLIPMGWPLYALQQRKELRRLALSFSYASLAAQIRQQPSAWKRHWWPIVGSLLAACLIIGLARPTLVASVPVNSVDMMLVMDISLSMMADDIRPTRMQAAKEAAIRFVDSLPRDARVGLAFFAGDNYVLSPPTDKHGEITAYLQALRKEDLKPRTEIGSALHTALQVLKKESAPPGQTSTKEPQTATSEAAQPPSTHSQTPPDRVIILLSDGDSHEGYPWDLAAREAKGSHVIIHSVGIGSPQGGIIHYQGMELPVNFSESTLRQIADITGGSYFRVFKESDFRKVYNQIQRHTIHYEEQSIDLAFVLAGCALLVLVGSIGLALVLL